MTQVNLVCSKIMQMFLILPQELLQKLFSIQYSENSEELSNSFIFFNAPATSGGAITNRPNVNLNVNIALKPTETLINAFELGDERYSVSIGEWTGKDNAGNIETFYYCAKYKVIKLPD